MIRTLYDEEFTVLCSFTYINLCDTRKRRVKKMTSTLFDRIGNCASIDSIYIVKLVTGYFFALVARLPFAWKANGIMDFSIITFHGTKTSFIE